MTSRILLDLLCLLWSKDVEFQGNSSSRDHIIVVNQTLRGTMMEVQQKF